MGGVSPGGRKRWPVRRLWAVLALAAAAVACGGRSAPHPTAPVEVLPPAEPTPPRVVIVSIDGLRPDAVAAAGMPTLSSLAARGAYSWQAQTIMPSVTLPAHASMLSGYPVSAHGITWDDYRPQNGPIGVSTVFSVAHAAGLRTVMVVGKEKFKQLVIPGSVDRFELRAGIDDEVAAVAAAEAQAGFDLMFVHLPQTDLTGHAEGWMSGPYLAAAAGADRALERVLAALPAGTTVIVTADHGGHDFTHGSSMAVDMTIPWVVAGPRVAAHALSARVHTVDTAATAAWVLGLRLAVGASGQPVTEAFTQSAAAPVRAAR